MAHEDELIGLILAVGILVFILSKYQNFKKIHSYKIILYAFYFIFTGFLATVLEEFFFNKTFNYLEHLCYVTSAILITIWSWRLFKINGD